MFLPKSENDIRGIIRQNRRVAVSAKGNYSNTKSPEKVFNDEESAECWYSSATDEVKELTISFRSSRILITNYSIESPCGACSQFFPKTWILEGYDEGRWDTLSDVKESGFDVRCSVKTFVAKYYAKSYQTFKFTQAGPPYGNGDVFAIQALDFFGVLFKKKETLRLTCRQNHRMA